MIQAGITSIQLLLLIPLQLPDAIILVIGAASAFAFTYLLTFGVRAFCYKMGWLDHPATRRVHTKAVPRLGGVAMFVAFVLVSLLFYTPGSENEVIIYWLLLAAATLMVEIHAYDDILGMKQLPKLLAQTIAVVIVLGPWGGEFHGSVLFTFNNPFGREFMRQGVAWYLHVRSCLFIHHES